LHARTPRHDAKRTDTLGNTVAGTPSQAHTLTATQRNQAVSAAEGQARAGTKRKRKGERDPCPSLQPGGRAAAWRCKQAAVHTGDLAQRVRYRAFKAVDLPNRAFGKWIHQDR